MAHTLITAPTAEPVSTVEAKAHLRVDISDDDTLIDVLVAAAREDVEARSWRALITQTWELVLDEWPSKSFIELPRPPLQSVTSVKYKDQDGSESTWAASNYIVDTDKEPGRVHLANGISWPTVSLYPTSGIRVRYVAGYGDDAADVPRRYVQAIKLMVGHLYENREAVVVERGVNISNLPLGYAALLGVDTAKRY